MGNGKPCTVMVSLVRYYLFEPLAHKWKLNSKHNSEEKSRTSVQLNSRSILFLRGKRFCNSIKPFTGIKNILEEVSTITNSMYQTSRTFKSMD